MTYNRIRVLVTLGIAGKEADLFAKGRFRLAMPSCPGQRVAAIELQAANLFDSMLGSKGGNLVTVPQRLGGLVALVLDAGERQQRGDAVSPGLKRQLGLPFGLIELPALQVDAGQDFTGLSGLAVEDQLDMRARVVESVQLQRGVGDQHGEMGGRGRNPERLFGRLDRLLVTIEPEQRARQRIPDVEHAGVLAHQPAEQLDGLEIPFVPEQPEGKLDLPERFDLVLGVGPRTRRVGPRRGAQVTSASNDTIGLEISPRYVCNRLVTGCRTAVR